MLEQVPPVLGLIWIRRLKNYTAEQQEIILNGSGEKNFHFHYENDFGGVRDVEVPFEGILKILNDVTMKQIAILHEINAVIHDRIDLSKLSWVFESASFSCKNQWHAHW